MKVIVSFLGALLFSISCLAISENNFTQDYAAKVIPFFKTGTFGKFKGVGNKDIAYMTFKANSEKGAILIVPGRVEPLIKYQEVIFDLAAQVY